MKPKLPRAPLPRQTGGAHNRPSRADLRNLDRDDISLREYEPGESEQDVLDWLLAGMVRTVNPETGEVCWVMKGDKDVV